MPRGRFSVDLVGQVFDRWTVVSRSSERYSNGSYYWNVKCQCGALGKVHTQGLTLGRSKSCGCLAKELTSNRMTKHGSSRPGSKGHQAYARIKHEKRKYGLTTEQKQQMLWDQHDCCVICGYEFGQKLGDYHIDHCHETGAIRGILCDRCNRGLGYFRDVPSFLRQAAAYLEASPHPAPASSEHGQCGEFGLKH